MIKKIILFLIILFCLIGCYNQKIEINQDKKSGRVSIDYELNDKYFQLLSIAISNFQSTNKSTFDSIVLIDQNEFKKSFSNKEGIFLKSVSIIKKDINDLTYYYGKIVIEFVDFEKALKLLPEGLINLNIKRDKDLLTISQTIDIDEMDKEGILKNFIQELKEDDIEFYNMLTKKVKFNFELSSKTNIIKSEGVNLLKDGKSVQYSFFLNDFLGETKPKKLFFLITL